MCSFSWEHGETFWTRSFTQQIRYARGLKFLVRESGYKYLRNAVRCQMNWWPSTGHGAHWWSQLNANSYMILTCRRPCLIYQKSMVSSSYSRWIEGITICKQKSSLIWSHLLNCSRARQIFRNLWRSYRVIGVPLNYICACRGQVHSITWPVHTHT